MAKIWIRKVVREMDHTQARIRSWSEKWTKHRQIDESKACQEIDQSDGQDTDQVREMDHTQARR
jgi:hypothetical protein